MSEKMEPVAWLTGDLVSLDVHEAELQGREYQTKTIPLYTKQQLQPRVKMAQEEFNEFYKLLSVGVSTIYDVFNLISEDRGEEDEFENLYNRLFGSYVRKEAANQIEFAQLWISFNASHPEETIEIIPEKKWFVRSKKTDEKVTYWYLKMTEHFLFHEYIIEIATRFDTKEQADEWTNPLTEAVLLPVGDE